MAFQLYYLYAGCLIFGVGYAVIISILGSFGGDHDGGCDHGCGMDASHGDGGGHDFHSDASHEGASGSGLSPFSPLMVATFSTLFGGLGFISLGTFEMLKIIPTSISNVVSVLISSSLGIILSSYFSYFLVKIFVKTETTSNLSISKLIGSEAEVTVDLEPGKVGEVVYYHGGSRQTSVAKVVEGVATLKRGECVEIVSISENVMWVKPIEKITPA